MLFLLKKNNKSTGTDQICAEILKASFDIVSPFLFKLYNRLFLNAEIHVYGEKVLLYQFSKADVRMKLAIIGV